MKVKLTICYDGTNYKGWQKQNNGDSIQQMIECGIFALTGEWVKVVGSGRTDAGVHAKKQIAHFEINSKSIPPKNFCKALNTVLPDDIKILDSKGVNAKFDASRNAKRKTYVYSFYMSDIENPLKERYSQRIYKNVDIEKMKDGAKLFVGEHDFKGYCASKSGALTTVRKVYCLDIIKKGEDVKLKITGNGFLYNMVRNIGGTLLTLGENKITKEDIIESLNNGKRINGIRTLPAKGLCLESVVYKNSCEK